LWILFIKLNNYYLKKILICPLLRQKKEEFPTRIAEFPLATTIFPFFDFIFFRRNKIVGAYSLT
jgi:hypothetical protein